MPPKRFPKKVRFIVSSSKQVVPKCVYCHQNEHMYGIFANGRYLYMCYPCICLEIWRYNLGLPNTLHNDFYIEMENIIQEENAC